MSDGVPTYWGPADSLPIDRQFSKERELLPERDEIEMEVREIGPWKDAIRKHMRHDM
jgi:hypothetical protein